MPSESTKNSKNYKHYHADGSLWATGKIVGGKMDGFWKWFRKDGSVMRSGYFKNGKQTGKWTTYNKNGKVVKVTDLTPKTKKK
jgi:antitoxin component YwqK of YwqJK toxin-antitoxin module